jgi:pimeloyl-ACP methyl ester carboxylesterase
MCAAMGIASLLSFRLCQSAACVGARHGQSEYDRDPDNYAQPVELSDLSAVLTALEIAPAVFVGTSLGGILVMMLALLRPTAIAGVILNDIGPVIEPQGLLRIKGYVESFPSRATSRRVLRFCAAR